MKYLLKALFISILIFDSAEIGYGQVNTIFPCEPGCTPEYPGGEMALDYFIKSHIKYPDWAKENEPIGRVVVGFIVNEDGSLSDFSIKKSFSPEIDSEALRVVMLLPKFTPALNRGRTAKSSYVLPIMFKKPTQEELTKMRNDSTVRANVPVKKIFQVVEQMPKLPGGEEAMEWFLKHTIIYPDSALAHHIEGRVLVDFVINESGKISDVAIKKAVSPDIDAEAIRVVNLMPLFKPGTQKGKPVKVRFVLPILFKLGDDSSIFNKPHTR